MSLFSKYLWKLTFNLGFHINTFLIDVLLCGIVNGSELKSFKQTLSKTDYNHHHHAIVKLFSSKNGFFIFKLLQRAHSMCLLYSMFLKSRAAKSVGKGVLLTFFLVLVTNFFLKGLLFGTIFFLTNFQQNAQKQLHAKLLLIMIILGFGRTQNYQNGCH